MKTASAERGDLYFILHGSMIKINEMAQTSGGIMQKRFEDPFASRMVKALKLNNTQMFKGLALKGTAERAVNVLDEKLQPTFVK